MKTMKKLLSSFLAIAMIMSIIPTSIFATDTSEGTSDNRAKLRMVYMGTSDPNTFNPTQGSAYTPAITDLPDQDTINTWTADPAGTTSTLIWIGLVLSNVKTMDDATKGSHPVDKPNNAPAQGKSHFTEYADASEYDWTNGGGIYNIAVGLEYASKYLKPAYVSNGQMQSFLPNTMTKYDGRYTGYKVETADQTADIFSSSDQNDKGGSYTSKREDSILSPEDSPKLVYASIKTDSLEPANKIFGDQQKLNDDDLLVFVVPFQLLEKPTGGTKVIQAALNPSNFMIQTGDTSNGDTSVIWSAQWNADREATPEANLKNHIDYTGDLNLFPAKVDVTYDAGDGSFKSELAEENRKESVIEGGNPTLKYDGKDISDYLDPPVGKVFTGWYEDQDNDTNDKPFTTDSTVDEAKTVYAHYTDGYKVTFNLNGENAQFTDGTSDAKSFTAKMGESVIKTSLRDLIGENPTRADYTFAGWYTKTEGTFIEQYDENAIKGNTNNSLDLYAKWEPTNTESKQYTLHFDANLPEGGVASQADPQSVKYDTGEKLQDLIGGLPVPPKPQGTYEGYDFLGWYKNKSGDGDMLTEDQILSDYIDTGESNEATVYASWGYVLGPYGEDPKGNAITVKFDKTNNKYSGDNGGTYKYDTIKDKYVNYGDKIPNMPDPADMTLEGKGFDGWYTKQNGAGTKVTADTLINGDLDVEPKLTETTGQTLNLYANWSDQITISFDNNNGVESDEPDSIQIYSGQSLQDAGKTLPDNPTRENYEFLGWFYEQGDNIVQAEDTTKFTTDTKLHAKWRGKINVSFKNKSFVYNDTEQTPLTDGNLEISLLDEGNQKVEPPVTISDLTADSFTAQYKKNGEAAYNSDVPKDANKYDIKLTIKEETIQSLNKNKYMAYTPVTFDNEYDITAKPITLKVSKNYQYLNDTSGITSIVLDFNDGTVDPKPNITDIFTSDDIKVTFTGDKSADTEDAMPNAFGKYDIKVESTNTNYEIEDLVDSQPGGDADLHLVPLMRTVTFNFGDGKAAMAGVTQSYNTTSYTVTFDDPTGTNPTAGESIKATIKDNGDNTALPASGTDFIPPESYKFVKFVTLGEDEGSPTDDSPVFTDETDISPSAEELVVYAVYELDEVDVKFNDTKTTDKEDTVTYTVQAGQAIQDADAVKKVDGTVQTATDVPTPEKAPKNKKFAGWSTDKSFADGSISGDYHESDWTNHGNKFDKATTITGATDVYAVYILSDDASLKKPGDDGTGSGAVFKKDSSSGDDLPFANEQWEKQPDQKFDPDTDKHYLIVDDDETETVYGEITPSQPGSTVTVEVNGQPAESVTGPDENGKYTFTFKPEQTTYDDESDTNSSTKVEVTVTAPDGTTTETYEFDILQYATARVELNYGNSPVGMIMSDDVTYNGEQAKQAAVTAFKSTHQFSGVTKDLMYYTDAWTSYKGKGADGTDYNGDEDPYAMFVFQRESFKDVGFTAYDSMDKPVDDNSVSLSLTMKAYKGGYVTYNDTTDAISDVSASASAKGNNYVFTEFTEKDIRPDVYDLTYTFTDPILSETVTQVRKIVAISKHGDVRIDSNGVLNNGDATDIIVNVVNFQNPNANSLYKFRIADTRLDVNRVINNGDATDIIVNVTTGLPQFYEALSK